MTLHQLSAFMDQQKRPIEEAAYLRGLETGAEVARLEGEE